MRKYGKGCLPDFEKWLAAEEKSKATQEKYVVVVQKFLESMTDGIITKQRILEWKDNISQSGCAPSTANTKIAAVNCFLEFVGQPELRIKPLKIQKKVFRREERDLSRDEYLCLVSTAEQMGQHKMALVMETICSTGIRVSELRYITREAAEKGHTNINLKGKIRAILLPDAICRRLLQYCEENGIYSGEIFLSRSGKSLCRKQIWAKMKRICEEAGIEPSKVFPHNLRHLFAVSYYKVCNDMVKLADVLGHSSIDTTRIYLISTGEEHMRILNAMQMVI